MGRHGYVDDLEQKDLAMWRGRVTSALRGKRGQAMLRELAAALDAMPEKRLISGLLKDQDGCVCTTGCILAAKNVPDIVDDEGDDHGWIAGHLNVAECVVQEIEYKNDEYGSAWDLKEGKWIPETPEQRWTRMRAWVDKQLTKGTPR